MFWQIAVLAPTQQFPSSKRLALCQSKVKTNSYPLLWMKIRQYSFSFSTMSYSKFKRAFTKHKRTYTDKSSYNLSFFKITDAFLHQAQSISELSIFRSQNKQNWYLLGQFKENCYFHQLLFIFGSMALFWNQQNEKCGIRYVRYAIKGGAVVVSGLQSGLQMHSNGEKAKAT